MKISTASKKVLASALSAAMVVAFAPTVAFGSDTVVTKNSYVNAANGQTVEVEYYNADTAFKNAMAPSAIKNAAGTGSGVYEEGKSTVSLADDATITAAIAEDTLGGGGSPLGDTTLTVDLGGKTLTSSTKDSGTPVWHKKAFTAVGDGTIAAAGTADSTFEGVTVGTEKLPSNVVFDGGVYKSLTVAQGSAITLKSGVFRATTATDSSSALYYAIQDAINNGATVTTGNDTNPTGTYTAGTALTLNNYYKVSTTVAKIGANSYGSLADAYANATAGNTIVLEADIAYNSADGITTTSSKPITVDLNGHTIERAALGGTIAALTLVGTGKLLGGSTAGTVNVGSNTESANITVADSAAKKTEKVATPVQLDGAVTVAAGSTLTVEGTKAASAAALDVYGTVTIAKGDFASLHVQNNASATVAKGDFDTVVPSKSSAVVVETGGTLSATQMTYLVTATANAADKLDKKFIASGSVIDAKSATVYEVGAPVATAYSIEKSQDGKTEFKTAVQCASLTGAVYPPDKKTTVTLDADIEENAVLALHAANNPATGDAAADEVVVDLNGKTVKGGIECDATGKTITLKNGTVTGNGCEALKVTAGTLEVESGTYTAEAKTKADGNVQKPTALTTNSDALNIKGGTFKDATYKVNASAITGGTFDKKPTVAGVYTVTENADGTYTVVVGKSAAANFSATGGVIKLVTKDSTGTPIAGENAGDVFSIADADKTHEKADEAAYAKVVTAAWAANPAATALEGFEFFVSASGVSKTVKDLTTAANTPSNISFALDVYKVDSAKSKLTADKDYAVDQAYDVKIVVTDSASGVLGYLTGIAADVTYVYTQDTANYTYKFLGDEKAAYDATKKAYTFSTTSGAQFGVEKISNSILELQEQMKQIEIAAQDKAAANSIKGTAKTIKTKKGVTAKKYTVKVKAVTSESGAVATFKKANTAGKSKITVAKSGTITIKKGLKKGTYKVKVKGTIGASSKTVTCKIVIK